MKTLIVMASVLALCWFNVKVEACSTDAQCPLDQCCARTLGIFRGCVDLSTFGQLCGKSLIGLCGCTKGLTCLPKHGVFNVFTFGEGHCGLPNTGSIVASTTSASSNQQAPVVIG